MRNSRKVSQPKPLLASDIDGTIFKSSLTEKFVASGIETGLFNQDQFRATHRLKAEWQRDNTEANYVKYLDALVGEFVLAINGVNVRDFGRVTAVMLLEHHVRRFRFVPELRGILAASHLFAGISGSPVNLVKPFMAGLSPDFVFGSTLEVADGVYTGSARNVAPKDTIIDRLVEQGIVTLAGSVAVGDTINDAKMLQRVDVPVMYNPSATLRKHGMPLGWHWVDEGKDDVRYFAPVPSTDGQYGPYEYVSRPVEILYRRITDMTTTSQS